MLLYRRDGLHEDVCSPGAHKDHVLGVLEVYPLGVRDEDVFTPGVHDEDVCSPDAVEC